MFVTSSGGWHGDMKLFCMPECHPLAAGIELLECFLHPLASFFAPECYPLAAGMVTVWTQYGLTVPPSTLLNSYKMRLATHKAESEV